jgi:hypothetical protein
MKHPRSFLAAGLGTLAMIWATTAFGQVPASASSAAPAASPAATDVDPPSAGTRRALVLCGLAGDAPHRKLFGDSLELLYSGLASHGFAAENVHVLWGDEPTEKDGPGIKASRGISSRENITKTADDLQAVVQPADALWVIVLGHAHHDGRYSWLNIPGDDIHQLDFSRLFEGIRCREQVFIITTPVSGYYLKPLALPGRIVITATEPDLEVNETLYPHKLARALSGAVSYGEMEMDRDGKLSLLDLYLWIAKDTAQEYLGGMLLSTEHALIDDNGDGRGTEIQIDYLSEELGGRLRAADQPPARPKLDGLMAQKIPLLFPPSPPVPEAQETP